jgi:hypothetical protein
MSTSAAATTTTVPKAMGSPPEAYDGALNKAQAFWSALENYFYLNDALFTDENRKIATALTFFKIGTSAREWARDKQKKAMAATPISFGTWAAFKTAFEKHFIPAQSQLESTKLMYNLKMGTRDFNSWYQEWSTHAERADVDENTRMFTFRNCIPQSLHQKIIMNDPQPTTMTALVEKARTLDRAYQIWGPSNRGTGTQRRGWNARGTAIDESGETQINLYEVGDRRPQSSTRGKRLSREEKDRRFKANLCFFCGKPGHRVKDCDVKKSMSQGRPSGGGRNTRTRQLATEETEPQEDAAPAEYDGPREAQVARFYPSMGDRYDIIRPKSAPVNEDF